MAVNLIISRVSEGEAIKDKLANSELGLNHGETCNNITTLNEKLFIRHNGTEKITDLKLYVSNLAELLEWSDAISNDGLLIDLDNDEVFETNVKTGVADTDSNSILIGDLEPAEETIIRLKIKVPSSELEVGIRKFNLNFNFDYTV